ncbi:MAG: aromatic ring-hydroxylating dioxygenase subunit alpha [Pseudomonadota bacterium]
MFIRNAWYVAGLSVEFGRDMKALRILGADVVIFRRTDGSAAALEDACPHRRVPLSMGRVEGDRIVCGYHGLTFDGAGRCVAAPTQPDAIPSRARVKSYPVIDRYEFLWIWMGDAAQADPAKLIDIPNFYNPAWGKTDPGHLEMACNYLWIMENLLDPSHVAWVHVTSFAGGGTDDVALQSEITDEGVIVFRWINDRPAPPYYAPRLRFTGHCDRKQHYEVRMPSTAINKSVFAPAGTGGDDNALPEAAFVNYSYNFMTPVDAAHTRYFWFQHRNSDPDNEAVSQAMFEGAVSAFNEDRRILEAVQKGMSDPARPHINLGIDAGAMRFRKMIERRIEAEQGAEPV